jgi:nucleotide-binding universal stress UspA family protein
MSAVVVFPPRALDKARGLLEPAGWAVDEGSGGPAGVQSALDAARDGKDALYLPEEASVAAPTRRIIALHDGTPASAPAVGAAGRVAGATGAHVHVLHVPPAIPESDPGSLAGLRMSDHGGEVWAQWRQEFARRFCTFTPDVSWDLDVAMGPPVEAILDEARRVEADMIVATAGPEVRVRPEVLRHVADGSPCPVLIVPRPTGHAAAGGRAQADTPARIPER